MINVLVKPGNEIKTKLNRESPVNNIVSFLDD